MTMLRNHAYRGAALFRVGKGQARRAKTTTASTASTASAGVAPGAKAASDIHMSIEPIAIAVPPLVSDELFAAAQEQLHINRLRNREQQKNGPHLLQGLAVCQMCGRAYCFTQTRARPGARIYHYYRCGSMVNREGRERTCTNPSISAAALEEAVWQDVSALLREPRRLVQEYQRRLQQTPKKAESLTWLGQQHAKEPRVLARLIDAYENELLEKDEFTTRIERARKRLQDLQTQIEDLHRTQAEQSAFQQALGGLEAFAHRMEAGLNHPTPTQQRTILKALVKRVEVAPDRIRVIYKIHPLPDSPLLKLGNLQDCSDRAHHVTGTFANFPASQCA